MLLTLHRYIIGEMLKTFALCQLALTMLVTMGGGVANLLRVGGVGGFSALEVIKNFVLFIPIAATFVLPVAAMFAAAITYGRLSADNEVTAARAAGINIHRLLWSAVLLGLATTGVTFYSWNYFIPRCLDKAASMMGNDICRMAVTALKRNGWIQPPGTKMSLHADHSDLVEGDPNKPLAQVLELRGVAFVQLDGMDVSAYGTAQTALVEFDQSSGRLLIRADLQGVCAYDVRKSQYVESARQPMGPYELPRPVREKFSAADLDTLRYYTRAPTKMKEIEDQLRVVRRGVLNMLSYDYVARAVSGAEKLCRLESPEGTIELSGERVSRSPKYGDLAIAAPRVTVRRGDQETRYAAGSAKVMVKDSPMDRDRPFLELELGDVQQTRFKAGQPDGAAVSRGQVRLGDIAIPATALATTAGYTDEQLLSESVSLPLSADMQRERGKLITRFFQKLASVHGLIHFRSALAASCIAMIVLAAMLGIIFRQSHMLTAFGVSCVPGLFISLAIVTGKNLAEYPNLNMVGLGVMWGVNVVVAVAAVFVAWKYVAR